MKDVVINASTVMPPQDANEEIKRLALAYVDSVPEWLYFGNRDTPRCISCHAWKKNGEQHKPDCKRVQILRAIQSNSTQTLK